MTFILCFDTPTSLAETSCENECYENSYHFIEGDVNRQSKLITAQRRRAALLLVFHYLNPVELCGLARVCREWRAMSEHPALWKEVALEEIPLNNMVSLSY